MRKIPLNEIPNTISRERKVALSSKSVYDPGEMAFAVDGTDGTTSWTQDGREDLAVYPDLVCSLLLQHRNVPQMCATGTGSAWFKGSDDRIITGDQLVWGALSAVNVTIMGTDDAPVLVVADTGRQQCKAAEWLTGFLAECRDALKAANGDAFAAQAAVMAKHTSDAVVRAFAPIHWAIIWTGGSSTRRPLVGWGERGKYSTVFWVQVSTGGGKPQDRGTLERAKLARLQVPSSVSGEADSLRKLVLSYMRDTAALAAPHSEETALEHAASFVAHPMSVGATDRAQKEAWTKALYRFSMVCDAVREQVNGESDPRKMLTLFDRAVKRCVKPTPQIESVGEHSFTYSVNGLTEEQQVAAFAPQKRTAREKVPAPTSAPRRVPLNRQLETARRLTQAAKSPMSTLPAEQKTLADGIARYLAWEAGDSAALPPELRKLLNVEEEEAEDDTFTDLKDFVEHWTGSTMLEHDNEAVQAKLDVLRKEIAHIKKPDERALAAQEWLLKQAVGG